MAKETDPRLIENTQMMHLGVGLKAHQDHLRVGDCQRIEIGGPIHQSNVIIRKNRWTFQK